jgi:hypothetical protein
MKEFEVGDQVRVICYKENSYFYTMIRDIESYASSGFFICRPNSFGMNRSTTFHGTQLKHINKLEEILYF